MTLAMTRPWKHPRTGIFWLRKRVPKDLLPSVGKREEKRSLATRNPTEAKQRLAEALLEVETRWATLRSIKAEPEQPTPLLLTHLTERDAHKRAEWIYEYWLNKHRDNPSGQTFWPVDAYDHLWVRTPARTWAPWSSDKGLMDVTSLVPAFHPQALILEQWCFEQADELLEVHDMQVDPDSRGKLAKALSASVQRASLKLARWARGDFEREENPVSSGNRTQTSQVRTVAEPALPFDELIRGWASEKRPVERTLYEWKRVFADLAIFLGHDDAHRLAATNLLAWKAKLIELGRRPKTIRDGRLAPVRAILQWAVDNGHLDRNVAERIVIDVRSKPGERKRSFTDEEAAAILKAANQEKNAVKNWVPWLCAYSGARISEICQLRAEDVRRVEGVWAISFSPEAGNLKNINSERVIPIHPALIDRGFITFAERIASGPLFAELTPDRFGKRGGNGTKVLGRWVRSLGLTDTRLSPVHSWRHRFKTSGRRHGLAPDMLDVLTGHAPRTVADGYGEYPMQALLRELAKIPTMIL